MLDEEGDHAHVIPVVYFPSLHYMSINVSHLLSHFMLEQTHSVIVREHFLYVRRPSITGSPAIAYMSGNPVRWSEFNKLRKIAEMSRNGTFT